VLDGDRATGESYCLAHHVYSADGKRRPYVDWTETRTVEAAS
jgi:hypothetical protein